MLWANHKLRLIVTSKCNLKCFYCHNEGQPKGNDFLSTELVHHLLRVVSHRGDAPKVVTISGGEPLLHPQLDYMVRALSSVAAHRTVVTNGVLLDQERLDTLRRAGVTKLRIGVDSVSQPGWRPSAMFPEGFSICRTMDLLQRERMPFEINVVLTHFNRRDLPEMLQLCRDRLVSAKFFEHVNTRFSDGSTGTMTGEARPFLTFGQFEECLRKVIPLSVQIPSAEFDGANEVYECGGYSIRYCRFLCQYGLCYLTGTRVDARGFVYSCLTGSGRFRISSTQAVETSGAIIDEAASQGCSAGLTQMALTSAG